MNIPIYKELIPAVVKQYNDMHHHSLNIETPVTFTEKIQWLKIYDSSFLKTFCADKIKVHTYFRKMLGDDIGIPIVKIFDDVNNITDMDLNIPSVFKCNHGSGMNIIMANKLQNLADVKKRLSGWLTTDYGIPFYERHYSLIKPTVFKEQYITDMCDVKVFCFNGVPKFYQIDKHFTEHRMNFYDLDWKPLLWLSNNSCPANYNIIDEKPPLSLIYNYADKLCKPFKFVRCDFIVSRGRVYGGELTFTPGAGNQSYSGDGDRRLGNMLDLQ